MWLPVTLEGASVSSTLPKEWESERFQTAIESESFTVIQGHQCYSVIILKYSSNSRDRPSIVNN